MNGMNYLAQLALMLHGSGMRNQYGAGDDPYAPPTSDDWSGGYGSVPGSYLPVTPAQETVMGTVPFEVLAGRTMTIPRQMPFPRFPTLRLPRVIPMRPPLPTDEIPLPPFFPPPRKKRRDNVFGFPDGSTEIPAYPPYNPPFETPEPGVWDDINRLNHPPIPKIPEDDEECQAEWDDAFDRCNKEFMKMRKMRTGEHLWFDLNRCAKKYVSERCGGNAVDWGPRGKPPAPEDPDPAGVI